MGSQNEQMVFLFSHQKFTSYKITIDDDHQLDILDSIMETVTERGLEIELEIITKSQCVDNLLRALEIITLRNKNNVRLLKLSLQYDRDIHSSKRSLVI